jgi:hypothetical protein
LKPSGNPYFSGFKEPSESSHPLTVLSFNADDSTEPQVHSARIAKRRKIASEENSKSKRDEQILKKFVIKKNYVRAREDIQKTMARFKPQVDLLRLNPLDIFRLNNDWKFLGNLKINDTIEFRCEIIAMHAENQQFLVRWFPAGIIEDSWIARDLVPRDGVMKVDVQKMNWKEKLNVRNKLINYSWNDPPDSARDQS